MTNFYTEVIQKSLLFNTTAAVRSMDLLEPTFRTAVLAIIDDAQAAGIRLMVTETYRSAERQAKLFQEGSTQLKAVGVHHYGLAADFCKLDSMGRANWAGDWAFLRDLAVKHGVISGLDWGLPGVSHSFVDPDHVQGCSVGMQPQLFAGTWYPGEVKS